MVNSDLVVFWARAQLSRVAKGRTPNTKKRPSSTQSQVSVTFRTSLAGLSALLHRAIKEYLLSYPFSITKHQEEI
jgi:hypothetical protein